MSPLSGQKAVVAKLGMDAHWRGAIVVANALREAGMEVVYLGHADATTIARTALQEDAVLVGLSTLSGNHLVEAPPVADALREAGIADAVLVVGGSIPPDDAEALQQQGVDDVFGTGSSLEVIVERAGALVQQCLTLRGL